MAQDLEHSSSRSLSIDLPSIYPVSSCHAQNTSFKRFLCEKLKYFDEIFGSCQPVSQHQHQHQHQHQYQYQQQQQPNNHISLYCTTLSSYK